MQKEEKKAKMTEFEVKQQQNKGVITLGEKAWCPSERCGADKILIILFHSPLKEGNLGVMRERQGERVRAKAKDNSKQSSPA